MALPVLADSLQLYLGQVNQFPVLERDEEYRLAVRYYENKDLDAAHKLVVSNLRFVVKIAMEYQSYGMRMADLIQEGNIGLMVAVKKFDPYKGYRLISYAVWWIRSHIQAFILKSWSLVKHGGRKLRKKLFYQFEKTEEALSALDGDYIDHEDHRTRPDDGNLYRQDLSLNTVIGDDGGITHLDMLQDTSPGQEDMVAEREEKEIVKRNLSSALAVLNDRERYVLDKRVMSDIPLSLQVIGDELGLTRERVRQIEKEAIGKLKRRLAD